MKMEYNLEMQEDEKDESLNLRSDLMLFFQHFERCGGE